MKKAAIMPLDESYNSDSNNWMKKLIYTLKEGASSI